jgi:hypothetical protein
MHSKIIKEVDIMAATSEKSMTESQPSLLIGVHERFSYEIYQDFQEYIYGKLKRPSSIIMRRPDNTVRSCLPRIWNRGFCGFCKELRDSSIFPNKSAICVQEQQDYVSQGIIAEESGLVWKWGWRTCHMGLDDFFVPIRSIPDKNSKRSILAVLIVGHCRSPEGVSLQVIHKRVDDITIGKDWRTYFPETPLEKRKEYAEKLHNLAVQIPVINEREWKEKEEPKIKEAVTLMGIIATRTLHKSMLFQAADFIQSLGLDKISINIGEDRLWFELGKVFPKILEYFNFDNTAIYASIYSDYTDLKCRLSLPPHSNHPGSLGLRSYGSFEWLTKQNFFTIPTSHRYFSWFNPNTFFKSESAIIYAKEILDGHLIIVGFGGNRIKEINAYQRVVLYDTIINNVFKFIENAFFGITLDHLMIETGHLMGRAYGKVASGNKQLKKIEPYITAPNKGEIIDQAFWAIDDGVTRLELIKSNFYSFRSHRIRSDEQMDFEEKSGDHEIPENLRQGCQKETKEKVDIIAVINGLKCFFDRSVKDRLKPIQFEIMCDMAITEGPLESENKLRLVFLNLFDNAMKFAWEDTFIKIEVKRDGEYCKVDFYNLGVGVAPDEFERVFRRLTKSRYKDPVKRIEGIGLGLPYCRRIIEDEFKGEIFLNSWEVQKPQPRRFEGDNYITKVTIKLKLIEKDKDND